MTSKTSRLSAARFAFVDEPADSTLSTAIFALLAIGLVAVFSASTMKAHTYFDSSSHFLSVQLTAAMIGLLMMLLISRIPITAIEKFTPVFGLFTAVILGLVLVPAFGAEVGGARRWLNLGPLPRFQPSEFARVAAVLLVARFAARRPEEVATIKGVGKALAGPLVFAVLILFEPDLDTGMTILLISGIVLFAAGLPWRYVITLLVIGAIALVGLISVADYRMDRILGFMDPWADMKGRGWHVIQGWIAMGSGGLFGRGLGNSIQKHGFLPEPHTDFIFAIIGEEGGFVFSVLIVVLFGVVAWRGYRIAASQKNNFACYVAVGITSMITLQALLNLMVVTGLAPTTGVPLPLISYGGTSLVLTMCALGILLGLSRRTDN